MATVAYFVKGSLYVTLFVCFVIFYFYDEMMAFMKGSTTFARSYAMVEQMAMPSFILCMPGVNPEAQEKYG